MVFVDKSKPVACINDNPIMKIQNLYFMMTRKFDCNAATKTKIRMKMDEINNLFSTYGYYSMKANLSSRFGGYHSASGLNLKDFDSGFVKKMDFGGASGREQKRREYCLNQSMWADLDSMNCESYKNDVILGNV